MDWRFNVTVDNDTLSNGTLHAGTTSHCFYLYEYSRTVYIPILHALVMIVGLIVNLYMFITLYCIVTKGKGAQVGRRHISEIDVCFAQVGFCDTARLMTIPLWVTQTILAKGWIFGYLACKLVRGLMTFCFQYGILMMIYVNVERYMAVVHLRTTVKRCNRSRGFNRLATVCAVCAAVATASAIVDMCYYTTHPVSNDTAVCFNGMHPRFQLVAFWIRMHTCFILPILCLVYCNGMIVYSVRKHVTRTAVAGNMRRAQVLPFLTTALFVCCWIPWIVSTTYYRSHVQCEQVKYVVLNVCIAIGNIHCITSPTLYVMMRFRKYNMRHVSLRSVDTPPLRVPTPGSQSAIGE